MSGRNIQSCNRHRPVRKRSVIPNFWYFGFRGLLLVSSSGRPTKQQNRRDESRAEFHTGPPFRGLYITIGWPCAALMKWTATQREHWPDSYLDVTLLESVPMSAILQSRLYGRS